MGTNSKRVVLERRQKIIELTAKCYSQSEIAQELGVTRQTISSDLRFIREENRKMFGRGSMVETLNYQYHDCMHRVEAIERELWKVANNRDNDPEINRWQKLAALKHLRQCAETRFNMLVNGPALMEVERLDQTVKNMRANTFDEKGNLIRPMSDEELENLDKP